MTNDYVAEHLGRVFDLLEAAIENSEPNDEITPLLEYALSFTEATFQYLENEE